VKSRQVSQGFFVPRVDLKAARIGAATAVH
jgi:hypothetical protein